MNSSRMRAISRLLFIASMGVATSLAAPWVKADDAPPASLFDDWAKGEDGGGKMKEFDHWKSPKGQHTLSYLKADQDLDTFLLMGKVAGNGKEVVLGRGLFGVDVTWMQTGIGEIAVIDHKISGGLNELFVVRPASDGDWVLLYRTPKAWAPSGLVMDHCYWSVLAMNADSGSLRLKAAWSFSNMTNAARKAAVTEGIYEIPLFHGVQPGGRHHTSTLDKSPITEPPAPR